MLPKLRDSALLILRRYGTSDEELLVEESEPGKPPYCELRGHRVKVHVDDFSATFLVKGGRWAGSRQDYPSAGAFVADFEENLAKAMSGSWR